MSDAEAMIISFATGKQANRSIERLALTRQLKGNRKDWYEHSQKWQNMIHFPPKKQLSINYNQCFTMGS